MKLALRRPPFPLLTAAAVLLLPVFNASAELRPTLKPEEMTSGSQTLSPLEALRGRITRSTAMLHDEKGLPLATATWVGKEGYFITKASEVPRLEKCTLEWGSESQAKVREIRRDTQQDIVLAQAIGLPEVPAITFAPSGDLAFGQWIIAPAHGKDLKMGVVSAQRRPIKSLGAAIGVRMDDKQSVPKKAKGVRIVGVAEDSPAADAGLKADDIMLELAGESVDEFRRVNEIISKRQPGDEIEVRYKRAGEEKSLHVRLASRTKVLANWDGEDFANGGISIRTDGFSQVIQHDLPLRPTDMGGPLLDLEGRALGLNIARVDRVTTFALPGEVFWPTIQKWMESDRNPPKAMPAKPAIAAESAP